MRYDFTSYEVHYFPVDNGGGNGINSTLFKIKNKNDKMPLLGL